MLCGNWPLPAPPGSRVDWEHLFPAPSVVTSPWQLEIGQSGSIHTPRTGACYRSGLGLSQDRQLLDASTPPPDPLITPRGDVGAALGADGRAQKRCQT